MASYSPYLQTVVTVFMALFGINFNIYFLLLIRSWRALLHDEELWGYVGIMVGSILLITWNLSSVLQMGFGEALHQSAFQVSSVMTTTGFSTVDFNTWPEFSRSLLVMLMIVGASAGSTGGGVKVARIIIVFKLLRKELIRMLHPRAVRAVHISGKTVDNKVGKGVTVFMAAYFAVFTASFLLVSLDNMSLETNVTAVVSCLSNIGPGLDVVGPMGNFSQFSGFSKIVLSLDMLFGRLEFFPLILLFSPSLWRRRWRKTRFLQTKTRPAFQNRAGFLCYSLNWNRSSSQSQHRGTQVEARLLGVPTSTVQTDIRVRRGDTGGTHRKCDSAVRRSRAAVCFQ